jgi:ABC-type lipopolysaccharide export system ATPase subunit
LGYDKGFVFGKTDFTVPFIEDICRALLLFCGDKKLNRTIPFCQFRTSYYQNLHHNNHSRICANIADFQDDTTMVLEIDSVNLQFDERTIISSAYLKIETGKVTAILGRNGTGKSCLMKILFGTLIPQNHSVRFNEKYIKTAFAENGLIKYLPQFNFFPNDITISKAFSLFDVAVEKLSEDLMNFDIKHLKFGNFSGGERRIIETLFILRMKSSFVLLDEPFSQISPLQIEYISKVILEEKKHKGILISDHRYKDVLQILDEIYGINNCVVQNITGDKFGLEKIGYLRD